MEVGCLNVIESSTKIDLILLLFSFIVLKIMKPINICFVQILTKKRPPNKAASL